MKYFIPLILPFLAVILMAESCNKSSFKSLSTKKAASYLLGSGEESSVKWVLSNKYDPYQGGVHYPADSANLKYLELYADGQFKEWDTENKSSGKYYLNKKKSAIAFRHFLINGVLQDTSKAELSFRHEIRLFTEDSLVLAWQGRHGMMEETYVGEK